MSDVLIFGLSDFAELLYESIKINSTKVNQNPIGFVIDDDYYKQKIFCNERVYRYSELEEIFSHSEVELLLTIGYSGMNQYREKIFHRFLQDGWEIASYIDPDSIIRTKSLGRGNIIFDDVNIGIGCQVGDGNVFYPGAFLAHHCTVGSFNFFCSNVSTGGCVEIGNRCFLGNNSCTKEKIFIGDETLIGAGCYLSQDVKKTGQVFLAPQCVNANKRFGEKASNLFKMYL